MKIVVVLSILVPLVLCAIPQDFGPELKPEHLKEIYELKALTDEHIRLNKSFDKLLSEPLKVSEDDVSLWIYSRSDPDGKNIPCNDAKSVTQISSFRTSVPTVIIAHGWHNTYISPVNIILKDAYLEKADINVVVVDWDDLAQKDYLSAQGVVSQVGKFVGQFINDLFFTFGYSFDNFILVGHSLGAHICGFAGKETGGKVQAIVGLDPAGPLYLPFDKNTRLDPSDAQYVIAIHTCSELLGVPFNIGDVDFWPNGGFFQPGCRTDLVGTCSHSRAYLYFAESIISGSNDFIGLECSTFLLYETGLCRGHAKAPMGGFNLNPTVVGTYYLKTYSDSPYARGDVD